MLYKQRDDSYLTPADQKEFDALRTFISPSYFTLEMAKVLEHLKMLDNPTQEQIE